MDDISSRKQNTSARVDGTSPSDKYRMHIHYTFDDAQNMLRRHRSDTASSTLFSHGKRTQAFFTEDSHRYITALERDAMLSGVRRYERSGQFDSVQMRYSRPTRNQSEILYERLVQRYSSLRETLQYLPDMLSAHISPMRVWNASIVGAIFFGMFSMTLIYRYLGQQVSAEGSSAVAGASIVNETTIVKNDTTPIDMKAQSDETVSSGDVKATQTASIIKTLTPEEVSQNKFNAEVTDMVKGYPIETMLPYILVQDTDVASFLIAIGKKESNWGKRVPVLNGKDCFNYWGYRGIRAKMGSGGHTCFDSPEDAVNTVAKRIKTLVQEKKLNTPAKMIVWKCGSTCAGHSKEGVRKWISDVAMYLPDLE